MKNVPPYRLDNLSMRTRRDTLRLAIAIALLAFGLYCNSAFAATLLQIDFQDPLDADSRTSADLVTSGASTEFSVFGNAPTLNTGSAVGSGVNSSAANGYISLDAGNSNYIRSYNTGGNNNQYADYVPGNSSSTGTLAPVTVFMVIQPASLSGNRGLFSSAGSSNGGQTAFFIGSSGSNLTMSAGQSSNGGNLSQAVLGSLSFNADSWYFVAASYGTGYATSVYYRVLKDGEGTVDPNAAGSMATSGNVMPEGTLSSAAFTQPLTIGASTNSTVTPGSFFDGNIAYLQMESGYSGTTQYDAYFESVVVPEPASVSLLMLAGFGGGLFVRRQRR